MGLKWGKAIHARNRRRACYRATPSSRPSPPRGRRSQKPARLTSARGVPAPSPPWGEGVGGGATLPQLATAVALLLQYANTPSLHFPHGAPPDAGCFDSPLSSA